MVINVRGLSESVKENDFLIVDGTSAWSFLNVKGGDPGISKDSKKRKAVRTKASMRLKPCLHKPGWF